MLAHPLQLAIGLGGTGEPFVDPQIEQDAPGEAIAHLCTGNVKPLICNQ